MLSSNFILTILTDDFTVFPRPLRASSETVPRSGHDLFLPNHFQFISQSPIILSFYAFCLRYLQHGKINHKKRTDFRRIPWMTATILSGLPVLLSHTAIVTYHKQTRHEQQLGMVRRFLLAHRNVFCFLESLVRMGRFTFRTKVVLLVHSLRCASSFHRNFLR